MTEDDLLELAKKRFKLATEASAAQRKRETEDLEFQVPEKQWDEEARRARMGAAVANVPVPPKPIISVDKLSPPIQNVMNQARQAHIGLNIHPLSPDADDESAEVISGIIRQEDRDCNAEQARLWALSRSTQCGLGWYRINTKYDEAGGHPFDQVVSVERILYQGDVRIDPAAKEPDFSDANYAFIPAWISLQDYKHEFGQSKLAKMDGGEFKQYLEIEPDWVKQDGDQQGVLVVEYFYKEWEKKTFVALQDGQAVPKDEVTEEDELDEDIPERVKDVCTVWYCKLNGFEVLEKQEWNGHYIPLIPVIGRELQPFDKERMWVGMVRPARDAQRGYNWSISQAMMRAALEPLSPFIAGANQIKGREDMWQQANTRAFPVLLYNDVPPPGTQTPSGPPQRTPTDNQTLSVSIALAQQFSQDIMAVMQTYDPSLGQGQSPDQSGRAIQGLQGQSDLGNSHYIANLADISMRYEAVVRLDLIPQIYDRPGRLARTMSEEDESAVVMLNSPHVTNPLNEMPHPVVPHPQLPGKFLMAPVNGGGPQPIPPVSPEPGSPPAEVKHYDLREGVYGVEVTVGKSYQSRLDQGNEFLTSVIQASPELMQIVGDIVFQYKDSPGADQISERLKALIQQQHPNLFIKPGQAPDPQAMQAQLQAAQQHIQQLTRQLQQAGQVIQTKQVEQQGKLAQVQVKASSDERMAQLEAQVKLLIEKMRAVTSMTDVGVKHGQETIMAQHQAAHEIALASAQNVQETVHAQQPPAPQPGVPPFTASDPRALPTDEGI